MRPLAIVRPEPGATATADAARRIGLQPLVIPLFEIVPMEWEAPDPTGFEGLLLTSANALRNAGPQLSRLKTLAAYCVGETTAASALDSGLAVASTGSGGVDELLGTMPPDLRLLHLCGADRRQPENPAQFIVAVPIYRALPVASPDLSRIEGAVVSVHSPRAGAQLLARVDEQGIDRSTVAIAAISAAAASAAGDGWKQVLVAAEPNDSALLAIAARLCNNRG